VHIYKAHEVVADLAAQSSMGLTCFVGVHRPHRVRPLAVGGGETVTHTLECGFTSLFSKPWV